MATSDDSDGPLQPTLQPVGRPLDLVPVQLKEAALDSPTFRAVAVHYANQVEGLERWLREYVKQSQKLADRFASIQKEFDNFDHFPLPPPENLSQAVLDHDYTLLAVSRYGKNTNHYLRSVFDNVARSRQTMIDPLLRFIDATDSPLRQFNQARRALERSQAMFDAEMARYLAQPKTREASSLREDAFKLHEDRKAYMRASMDYCIMAPNLRNALDQLLINVLSDRWKDFRAHRDANFDKCASELERIRGWSNIMHESESAFKRELMMARRQLEDSAEVKARPSREIDDYAASTVPYLGSGAPASPVRPAVTNSEKQGWLFLKTVPPKPARPSWSRRWFIVKNGIFGWLVQGSVSGGVEESEKIGVLLCSVRPATQEERRFCFEIKTKDTTIILQAETQGELLQWINSFESAKRKALEEPRAILSSTPALDPAFAISPPVDPSFAAKLTDSLAHQTDDIGGSLSPSDLSLASRSSTDVSSSRRSTMVDSEGNRDTANRIIQKLDLHRRGTALSSGNQSPAAGGIASLLSASHSILPIGPTSTSPKLGERHRAFTMPVSSTFAPVTLANPPAPTSLSRRAVIVSGQRAVSGKSDTSAMPSSLMANLWGSSNSLHVNRLGRDDSKSAAVSRPAARSTGHFHDDMAIMEGLEPPKDLKVAETGPIASPSRISHRKTNSAGDAPLESSVAPLEDVQSEYPVSLKTDDLLVLKEHDAEFHVLFSSVPRSERVILVFTAMWNPNEQQEFPGRVYVTTKKIYFYSNHFGMVLVAEISMSSITEVTAALGRASECDYLFLHLKENPTDFKRVTIKTFLDALRPLQRRLDYLVHSANSDIRASLEEVFASFSRIATEDCQEPSGLQTWDEDLNSPTDSETKIAKPRSRDLRANLRIDGTLYGESVARTGREVTKFKLPSQPVLYKPKDMGDAVLTQDFGISAKALFHVMFGDRSAVFQMLYKNRPIDDILQTPWTKPTDGQLFRQLICTIGANQEIDRQVLDVSNDHLCYVVTQTQSPWHLPMPKDFLLLSKIVITHSTKSKCKLAIFNKVVWNGDAELCKNLSLSQRLVQKQALRDYQADAVDLAAIVTDQASKLGAHSKTNKAVQIFGAIGQSTQTSQVSASNLPATSISRTRRTTVVRTLFNLYLDEALAQAFHLVMILIDIVVAVATSVAGVVSAHGILVLLLALSTAYNTWYGYRDGLLWYDERNASKFMSRLGVKPDPAVARAIYLSDIEELVAPRSMSTVEVNSTVVKDSNEHWNTCHDTFRDMLVSSELDATMMSKGSSRRSEARLRQTRNSLARYRHDLLVALRVINRVEEEVVHAEWEDWVLEEERKCRKVESMLQEGRKGGKAMEQDAEGEEAGGLGDGFSEYCRSCKSEASQILSGR